MKLLVFASNVGGVAGQPGNVQRNVSLSAVRDSADNAKVFQSAVQVPPVATLLNLLPEAFAEFESGAAYEITVTKIPVAPASS